MSKETRAMRRRRGRSHDEAFERCRRSIGNVDGYEELCRTAFHFFTERNDELVRQFKLGRWRRYVWDMDAATLTFFDGAAARVVGDIEFVGTYAEQPATWVWSWANPSVAAAVTSRIGKVRDHGLRHGLVPLHADHWHAPESHAHEMTAVTTYLLGGRGGYRVTSGTPGTTIYLVIMAAQWVG